MQIRENISLRQYNTFGINAKARQFAVFRSVEELQDILSRKSQDHDSKLVLGGGSNVLFTNDFDGLVLKNEMQGIEVVKEDDDHIYVRAGAGINWHSLVMYCVEKDYAGMENLSLIPGNVGASPMQNIGAYGVEVKDVFQELEALEISDQTIHKFSAAECEFGYRESVFKRKAKGKFIILNVTFRLDKKPIFHTSYGAIEQELGRMGVENLSIKAVSQAVINIRSSKLPDPRKIGNAGSFFKNPYVGKEQFARLQNQFPTIPGFPHDNRYVKVPAGWLIEHCGWKGFRRGDAGCYAKQALVLVNYGTATGNEIYDLSEEILQSVKTKFGVVLEREVNIL